MKEKELAKLANKICIKFIKKGKLEESDTINFETFLHAIAEEYYGIKMNDLPRIDFVALKATREDKITYGQYKCNEEKIYINSDVFIDKTSGNSGLAYLLTTCGHELTHYFQDKEQGKKVFQGKLSEQKISAMIELLGERITLDEGVTASEISFSYYLQDKIEEDARENEIHFAEKALESLMKNKHVKRRVKKYLIKQKEILEIERKVEAKNREKYKMFDEFKKKIKELDFHEFLVLYKDIESGKKGISRMIEDINVLKEIIKIKFDDLTPEETNKLYLYSLEEGYSYICSILKDHINNSTYPQAYRNALKKELISRLSFCKGNNEDIVDSGLLSFFDAKDIGVIFSGALEHNFEKINSDFFNYSELMICDGVGEIVNRLINYIEKNEANNGLEKLSIEKIKALRYKIFRLQHLLHCGYTSGIKDVEGTKQKIDMIGEKLYEIYKNIDKITTNEDINRIESNGKKRK